VNIQDYLLAVPYKLAWHAADRFGRTRAVVFYCTDPLDHIMFAPIQKHLPPIPLVAANGKTARYLRDRGIPYSWMPVFPKAVVMCRHKPYKFPVRRIVKIGLNHGLYQFKRWTSTRYFTGFRRFLMSSETQVAQARARGITNAVAVGYPKIDPMLDGTYGPAFQQELRQRLGLDSSRPTIMFSATWNVSGLSALDRWVDRVHELAPDYNLLLTTHTWTDPRLVAKLRAISGAHYIDDFDVVPYLTIAELLVGDTSSLIGEFCALDRPMITFRVAQGPRANPEITEMLSEISDQVDSFDELPGAIRTALGAPRARSAQRRAAMERMITYADGAAGARAAAVIREELGTLLDDRG
jgi:hypothetical protein